MPAWTGGSHPLGALGQAGKHHLVDPALEARLLQATLRVRVLAQAAEATTTHLRTRRGDHEVDLIVERFDGRLVGVEAKLTASVRDEHVRHLTWLRDKLGDRVADLVVLTTGPDAYRRRDRVAVVPLGLLGP